MFKDKCIKGHKSSKQVNVCFKIAQIEIVNIESFVSMDSSENFQTDSFVNQSLLENVPGSTENSKIVYFLGKTQENQFYDARKFRFRKWGEEIKNQSQMRTWALVFTSKCLKGCKSSKLTKVCIKIAQIISKGIIKHFPKKYVARRLRFLAKN